MSQAHVDPAELRRFALSLKNFNGQLQAQMQALNGQLAGLATSWRDREHDKFVDEFQQTAAGRAHAPLLLSLLSFLRARAGRVDRPRLPTRTPQACAPLSPPPSRTHRHKRARVSVSARKRHTFCLFPPRLGAPPTPSDRNRHVRQLHRQVLQGHLQGDLPVGRPEGGRPESPVRRVGRVSSGGGERGRQGVCAGGGGGGGLRAFSPRRLEARAGPPPRVHGGGASPQALTLAGWEERSGLPPPR